MVIFQIFLFLVFLYALGFLITPNHIYFTKIKKTEVLRQFSSKFKSKNKQETLKKVYLYLINNFSTEKYNFFLQFYKLFYTDVEKLLRKKQFVQCTIQNLVLITLLINTGQFKENDFERKWTLIKGIIPHQYVFVKFKSKIFIIDSLLKTFRSYD